MATTIAVVGTLAGAYGAHEQASAANRSRNAYTDSTSTQVPYMWQNVNPGIEEVLRLQGEIARRGAPQIDSHGNVTYAALPGQEQYTGAAQAAATPTSTAKPSRAGNGPQTWTNAKGETMMLGPGGKVVKAPAGTTTTTGTPTTAAGPDLSTPQGIFGEVARRGLNAGNTQTQSQARNVMANIWGDSAAPGGTAAGGEQTGFERYNPILDRLTGTLEGDVNGRVGTDLLLNFLNENGRGNGANPNAHSPRSAGSVGSSYGPGGTISSGGQTYYPSPGGGYQTTPPPGWGSGGQNGGVPDTMVPESFFGTQTRKMFDEQANDAELQALIDEMNHDTERGMFRDLAQLDATAAGSGRFGGSTWAALNRDAREEALQEMNKTSAGVRIGDREARRQALLNALGQVNTRDLNLLGANVQREGIAAGERASNAASNASAGAAADQMALARRGQDLSAIGELLGNERYSLGQLSGVGGQLSGDRLSALGMVPGLEGIGLSGLQTALGAGGGLTDLRGQDTALRQTQIGAGVQRQGLNQQAAMFNAGQQQNLVNDYLRTLMGVGGMGGTSTTRGVNVQPGAGVSPTGSALQGAIGGGTAAYGAYNAYRGY